MTTFITRRAVTCTPRPTLLARLVMARAARRQRIALARLDASQLRDIGLTPDEARIESARKPWDVPANWRD